MRGVPCVRRRARQINGVRVQSGGGSQKIFSVSRPIWGICPTSLLLLLCSRPTSIGHSDALSLIFVYISIDKTTFPIGHGLDMGVFC